MTVPSFESDLSTATEEFLKCVYLYLQDESITFYHYTRKENALDICQSDLFRASFIRSTSDPLEFALPMSICRDWLCEKKETSNYMKNIVYLFQFFNNEVLSPLVRPYFMSMSLTESSHLKEQYGGSGLKLHYDKNSPVQFTGMLLQCKYLKDPRTDIRSLLDRWNSELFVPMCRQYSKSPEEQFIYSFFVFMKVAHTIALATKQSGYYKENEVRFALFTKTPDADHEWHGPRDMDNTQKFTPREYLPLKLKAMGITATQI